MNPAENPAVAVAINAPEFEKNMKSMLLKYEDLPTVTTIDGVNITRLGTRKQLMIDSFGLLELVIQTKRVFKNLDSVAVEATLFICTSQGYQPVFSRLGYASESEIGDTTAHSNVVGFAESNAEKRVLQALGLPDVKSTEMSTLRSQQTANCLKINNFIKKEDISADQLIQSFNSTSETQIRTKLVQNLSTKEASELAAFVSEANQ